MKNYSLIFIMLISVLLFSCKEDDTGNSFDCLPINLYNSGCKVVKIKKFYNSIPEEESVYTYENHRLAKIVTAYNQWDKDSSVLLYNKRDQISYLLQNRFGSSQLDTVEQYYYNESNQLNKVLFFNYDGSISSSNLFTYSNCKLDQIIAEYSHSESERFDLELDNRGNIINFSGTDANGEPITSNESIIITYDNALNPFRYSLGLNGFDVFSYFAKNNLTEISGLDEDSIAYGLISSYKYNSQNFPVEIVEISDGDTIISKLTYDCF